MRLVTVKATGKRYIYNGEHRDLVVCKGEVRRLNGLSVTHGPDKKFKRDAVWVVEVDLNEQLLRELYEQSDIKDPHECRRPDTCCCDTAALEPDEDCPIHGAGEWPPRCAECGRLVKWPTVEVVDTDPKWVEWVTDWDGRRRARLTKHADERLIAMGRDIGADMEGIQNFAQDAAMDVAAYLDELTREGVRTGYMVPCREAAADMIYEGITRALKERGIEG